jgi:UDP-N-acetylglucosamine 2-epimerase (non-hydrolysing)
MNKKRILVCIGTRPEAIKMCPLVLELKKRSALEVIVCSTGQHRELLRDAMAIFGVSADIDMDVMREAQTPTQVIAAILERAEEIFERTYPDTVVVHGDTCSAFAMALAAFLRGIPVAHVEAGLRSGNMRAPFPEEFNRRAISLAADLHFAPTQRAASNLFEEGVKPSRVFVTGNTVIDALTYTLHDGFSHPLLDSCQGKRIIFLTAHRRESCGQTLVGMLCAVRRICEQNDDVRVIFPVHPNPAVRKTAYDVLGDCPSVHLCEPLDVVDCHNIMANSYLALTDSGGIQEEAAALGLPVLVMRGVTERPEGIMAGVARLAGTDSEQIYVTVGELLRDRSLHKKMSVSKNPYGDGNACRRIADVLLGDLK